MTELRYDLRSTLSSSALAGSRPVEGTPLQAKREEAAEALPAEAAEALPVEPWFYGWRWRQLGEGRLERVPRSREDFLNPQEGDEMGQDSLHLRLTWIFYALFRRRYPSPGKITVFADLLTRFARKSLNNANPDVLLVEDALDPERRRRSYNEAKEAGKILLALEIVSADYASKDYLHNPPLYEQAGIREYLIVELLGDYLSGPYKLSGYRLDDVTKTYRPIQPNPQGQLYSAVTDLYISADPQGWGLAIVDRTTGERVLSDDEALEAAKLEVTEAKLEVTEAKLEVTEAKLEVTEAKAEVTEAKLEVTEAKAEAREAKLEVTEAKAKNRQLSEEIARLKGGT